MAQQAWRGRPEARRFGPINRRGLVAFYQREIRRGFKIWGITLAAPAIRALLFATVFSLVVGPDGATAGMDFLDFLIPGLITVAILERAFEASAFSMVYDKSEGIFSDVAMLPLTPAELVAGYAGAAVTAGLIGGVVVWTALLPLGSQAPAAPAALLYFTVSGSLIVGLFSQIAGLWAPKWDYINGVQVFIFMPFVFFSGVFFSLDSVPAALQPFSRANPIFYIVDGIRYGFTGRADVDPAVGIVVSLVSIALLGALSYRLFAIGYRYKF